MRAFKRLLAITMTGISLVFPGTAVSAASANSQVVVSGHSGGATVLDVSVAGNEAVPGQSGHRITAAESAQRGQSNASGCCPQYAGYAGYTAPKKLSATIVVPAPGDCATDQGVLTEVLELTPGFAGAAGVQVYGACVSGVRYHFVRVITADGSEVDVPKRTRVGDQIDVAIVRKGDKTRVHATNATQGWTYSASGPAVESIENDIGMNVVSSDGIDLPISDFGKVAFTGVMLDSQPLGQTDPDRFHCVESDGTLRMRTSKIREQTDFVVSFKSP